MTPAPEHSKPRRLASAILRAAMDQRWRTVEDLMARLNAECPGEGLAEALIGWCDTALHHLSGGKFGDGRPVAIVPMAIETGELGGDLTAEKQWAMDLIQARANMDRPAFQALLEKVNAVADGYARGQYAGALIQCCALSIRSMPYGITELGVTAGDAR